MSHFSHGVTTKQQPLDALLKQLDLQTYPFVRMDQVHGSDIWEYKKGDPLLIPSVDAIFTQEKNVVLSVRTADCLPILFYHPSGLIGGIHAGRASTIKDITFKTFTLLKQQFGLQDNFWIEFGPAICKDCYQIDPVEDIHFDLIEENKKQLASVLEMDKNTLDIRLECTSCKNDRYFSYRKEKTTERLLSVIARLK